MFSGSVTYAYRLDGLLATRSLPSSDTLTYGFDAAKRPTSLALSGSRSFSQTYDRTGNVTSESRTLDAAITGVNGSRTATYAYDALGRLTGETGLGTDRAYGYDLDGNRTSITEAGASRTTTFDRTDQPISQTQASVWSVTYTASHYGDMLTAPTINGATTTYAYDTAGRTKSVSAAGSTATMSPDALGRVATRTVGSVSDAYGYIGSGNTIVAIDGGTQDRLSVTGADGDRLATKDGSTVAFVIADLHGNIAGAMASASTTLVDAIRYDAYGKTLMTPYTGTGYVSLDQRYQGRLDLAPSGVDPLYGFGARDYAPVQGSFTSLDSVLGSAASPRSLNRFLYAEANPGTFTDPTGHWTSETDQGSNSCRSLGDTGCGRVTTSTSSKITPRPEVSTTPVCSQAACYEINHQSKTPTSSTPNVDDERGPANPRARPNLSAATPSDPGSMQLMAGPCASASAAFGLSVGLQGCILIDLDNPWQSALVITPSIQGSSAYDPNGIQSGSFGVVATATVGGMVTNARSADDVRGPFAGVGASGGADLAASGDVAIGQTQDGYNVVVIDAGLGTGGGVEFHGGPTVSLVFPFQTKDVQIPFVTNPFLMLDMFNRLTGGGS